MSPKSRISHLQWSPEDDESILTPQWSKIVLHVKPHWIRSSEGTLPDHWRREIIQLAWEILHRPRIRVGFKNDLELFVSKCSGVPKYQVLIVVREAIWKALTPDDNEKHFDEEGGFAKARLIEREYSTRLREIAEYVRRKVLSVLRDIRMIFP